MIRNLLRIRRSWATRLIGTVGCLLALSGSILFSADHASADKGKGKGRGQGGKRRQATPTVTPSGLLGEQSLTNIPLPIGHEAKGLVLPDFDLEGHLRGRFEAMSARRIDEEHVGFHVLKITTYTPENRPDLTIEMSESVLDLKTRILTSKERTTITRADFNIVGDSVQFDTNTHTGKMIGNVKMVVTDQSRVSGEPSE